MLDRKSLSLKCHGADKIQRAKKKLKGLNFSSIGINSAVYINDSLCRYYKNLWAKWKKLWLNKFIHGFWTSNGSIRLKLTETGNVRVITHDADFEELFPGNELISDNKRQISCKFVLCFIRL